MAGMLRIALLQLVSCGGDRDANLRKGEIFCRRAASAGAHIALFPEMWSVGYEAFDPRDSSDAAAWQSLAVARDEMFVRRFQDLARELHMAVGITYLERWPGRPRDAVSLFDSRGDEVLTYAKVHLGPWDPPDTACVPGEAFPVAVLETPIGAVQIGFMICFDREFPEAARMLMLNGAELILTPNACNLDDGEWGDVRIAQFRARAFENLAAVAMANYAAPQNDGNSVAFHPDGSLIVRGGPEEEIIIADVDLGRVRALRHREVGRDVARSPEKYGTISSTQHPRPSTRWRTG